MASAWHDNNVSEGSDLEQPKWIQCDSRSCEKWRKLQPEYILSVQVRETVYKLFFQSNNALGKGTRYG